MTVRIAIDAMGGDRAPEVIVKGTIHAARELKEIEFQLYGDQSKIEPLLNEQLTNVHIIHCSEKILSEDEPVKAIRSKKDASMVVAAKAVKEGRADAFVSAGNTGGLLAAGLLIIGRIKGIDRPGLMPIFPVISSSKNRQFIMMDVGANADCKPRNLHQFAILGTYYARDVLKIENPTVGLLNNGTEEGKGNELMKSVHTLLQEDTQLNFKGNVEARELLNGVADVVVTDGFTGNAVLKTIEGTALSILTLLKESILAQGIKGKLGGLLLKDAFKQVKSKMDYSQFGGAVLFGLKGPVIKVHGSTDEMSIYFALKQAVSIVSSDVVPRLVEHFENTQKEE